MVSSELKLMKYDMEAQSIRTQESVEKVQLDMKHWIRDFRVEVDEKFDAVGKVF